MASGGDWVRGGVSCAERAARLCGDRRRSASPTTRSSPSATRLVAVPRSPRAVGPRPASHSVGFRVGGDADPRGSSQVIADRRSGGLRTPRLSPTAQETWCVLDRPRDATGCLEPSRTRKASVSSVMVSGGWSFPLRRTDQPEREPRLDPDTRLARAG